MKFSREQRASSAFIACQRSGTDGASAIAADATVAIGAEAPASSAKPRAASDSPDGVCGPASDDGNPGLAAFESATTIREYGFGATGAGVNARAAPAYASGAVSSVSAGVREAGVSVIPVAGAERGSATGA